MVAVFHATSGYVGTVSHSIATEIQEVRAVRSRQDLERTFGVKSSSLVAFAFAGASVTGLEALLASFARTFSRRFSSLTRNKLV